MKVVTAIDSMKGSLTSQQANQIVANVFKDQTTTVTEIAIADGGEGTVAAFLHNTKARAQSVMCHNLCGDVIEASYAFLEVEQTAIIETAATCGISFLDHTARTHPIRTNSFGVGEQILAAIEQGAKKIIIGLGGTGTIDGGIGMLAALGFEWLDQHGHILAPFPYQFEKIVAVSTVNVSPQITAVDFIVATDVMSILTGSTGAVYSFGPQKGLQPDELANYEQQLSHYAKLLLMDQTTKAGDGAAGGIGLALRTALHAKVVSGLELVAQSAHLADEIANADLVITGEGKLDSQSLQGKVPVGIGRLAQESQVPVIAFVGSVVGDEALFASNGISAVIPIVATVCTLDEALEQAAFNLEQAATRTKTLLHLMTN